MRLIDSEKVHGHLIEYAYDHQHEFGFHWGDIIKFTPSQVADILAKMPTIVEFEGDINKVIVKGEEYHKQLTTTWLGNYCPYKCEHCGHYTDSKTPYCAWCGRRASNYEG